MGFFFSDDEAEAQIASGRKRARIAVQEVKRNQIEVPATLGCDHCGLRETWDHIQTPRMPTHGPKNAEIAIIGEAPGETEDREGMPFVGDSGSLLRGALAWDITEHAAWQNICRCRPKGNRTPTVAEMNSCSIYLDEDLQKLPLKVILGVGGIPLRRFIGQTPANITDIHGNKFPVQIGDRIVWYYPILHPSFILRSGGEHGSVYSSFADDLHHFSSTYQKWPKPQITVWDASRVYIAHTEIEVREQIARMEGVIGVDIECSSLRPFEGGEIISGAFSDGVRTVAFSVMHPEEPHDWGLDVLFDVMINRECVAHNAAFEYLWLAYYKGLENIPPPGADKTLMGPGAGFHDTMALARIYHERERLLNLAVLTRIHLGNDIKLASPVDSKNIMAYRLKEILPYNGLDAQACALLFRKLRGKADGWQINKILRTVRSAIAKELRGLPVDLEESSRLATEYAEKARAAEESAKKLIEVKEFEAKQSKEFNIGSNAHVAQALIQAGVALPKTAGGGGYSTTDEQLSKLAEEHVLARNVRDYREWTKLSSTYVAPILVDRFTMKPGKHAYMHDDGPYVHPSYTVMHTATLRLSGREMSAQNWPKRKHAEVRRQIKARPGHVIVCIDEGQLEARVLAMASKDKALSEAIITGYDIHADWRDKLLKIYPKYWTLVAERSGTKDDDKILKAARTQIKGDWVFAQFYGATVKSCANRIGCPLDVMTEFGESFWNTFSGVRAWIKEQRKMYKLTGAVVNLTGRWRRGLLYGNEPINYPIQATAADIVNEAENELVDLALREKDPFFMPRINVHDDLTFILPNQDDKLDDYINRIAVAMTRPRFKFCIVPLMVEVSMGENWADQEEIGKITGEYIHQ